MTTLQQIARVLRDPETNAYADELRRLRAEREAREAEREYARVADSEAWREWEADR